MTSRQFEPAVNAYGIWSPKRLPITRNLRRVVVAHPDRSVGESFVLLFGVKGLAAMYGCDMPTTATIIRAWEPQVVLFDTRLERADPPPFIKSLHDAPENRSRLLIAMCGAAHEESIGSLQHRGFDGYCRRPCALWHLAELLSVFYSPPPEV